jgi:hypothetical protein
MRLSVGELLLYNRLSVGEQLLYNGQWGSSSCITDYQWGSNSCITDYLWGSSSCITDYQWGSLLLFHMISTCLCGAYRNGSQHPVGKTHLILAWMILCLSSKSSSVSSALKTRSRSFSSLVACEWYLSLFTRYTSTQTGFNYRGVA